MKDIKKKDIEIFHNDMGVDDVFIKNVKMFRLERMGDMSFWIRCYMENGKHDVVFRLQAEGFLGITAELEDK